MNDAKELLEHAKVLESVGKTAGALLLTRAAESIEELQKENERLKEKLRGMSVWEWEELQKENERLNEMLRRTGYGQGQIDAYSALCEDNEACGRRIADLEKHVEELRKQLETQA